MVVKIGGLAKVYVFVFGSESDAVHYASSGMNGDEADFDFPPSTIGWESTSQVSSPTTFNLFSPGGGVVGQYTISSSFSGTTMFEMVCLHEDVAYVSASGDDANDGLTVITPKRTIQAGVDAVRSGGTVRVAAGTYVLSQTIAINRPLTVAGEAAFSTIVDGNGTVQCFVHGTVQCFVLSRMATITDLTVQNGYYYNASIEGNVSPVGGGAGVNLKNGAKVNRCIIKGNRQYGVANGGGVWMGNSGCELLNSLVYDNQSNAIAPYSSYGGGVMMLTFEYQPYGGTRSSVPSKIIGCTICDNSSSQLGAGLTIYDGSQPGSSATPVVANNIVVYNTGPFNYVSLTSTTQAFPTTASNVLGTWSVRNVNDVTTGSGESVVFYDRPNRNYRLATGSTNCIDRGTNFYASGQAYDLDRRTRLYGYVVDVGCYEYDGSYSYYDVYASPSGNDSNTGSNPSSPKRTIQAALSACLTGGTVHLSSGTFVLSSSVSVTGNRTISGDGAATTVVDGNDATRCFDIYDGKVEKLTVRRGNDSGVVIHPSGSPTGVFSLLSRCIVTDCYSPTYGGGVRILDASEGVMPGMCSCLVHHNTAAQGGGGISIGAYNMMAVSTCTVCYNSAPVGGGIYKSGASYAGGVFQAISFFNSGTDMYGASSTLYLWDCCYGTHSGVYCTNSPSYGCSNSDPMFVNPAGDDYRLQAGSPCIDKGWVGHNYWNDGYDLDGNPRVVGYTFDTGAYERQ